MVRIKIEWIGRFRSLSTAFGKNVGRNEIEAWNLSKINCLAHFNRHKRAVSFSENHGLPNEDEGATISRSERFQQMNWKLAGGTDVTKQKDSRRRSKKVAAK
jgi:hypothetical protein